MRDLILDLDPASSRPAYLRVADALIAAIGAGRLKPGDRLPGTRRLAQSLGLHRNTLDAAYQEAIHQGWLVTRPSQGTFIATDLPDLADAFIPDSPAASPRSRRAAPHALAFSDGAADPRLLPAAQIARALRRALLRAAAKAAPALNSPLGSDALREIMMERLSAERALSFTDRDIMVTRGSQMALFLAGRALLHPGEAIAVENPGYPLAASAFREAGARIVPITVDAGGLRVDALEMALAHDPAIRAVYVTPHHQYPTTVTLGAVRRLKLIELARRHDLTIIEDDYDHDYRFDGGPVPPIAARMKADGIVYIGSLSKLLSPEIRVGYAVGPTPVIDRMARLREVIDPRGDGVLEAALADLLRSGELFRHARKARRIYRMRRDRLADLLRRDFRDRLHFDLPAGGLAVWARVADGTASTAWSDAARQLGLIVTAADMLCLGKAAPSAFRLGYAALDDTELTRALSILDRAHGHVQPVEMSAAVQKEQDRGGQPR